MKIINTTPHNILLQLHQSVSCIEIEKAANPIRLAEEQKQIGYINHIPLFKKTFGSANLPPIKKGTVYIVSLIVAQSFPNRDDFLIVNDTIRDENGQIVGCKSLAHV